MASLLFKNGNIALLDSSFKCNMTKLDESMQRSEFTIIYLIKIELLIQISRKKVAILSFEFAFP